MALDGWNISVNTANLIVGNAQDDVDRLTAQQTTLDTSISEAATACDHADITSALDGLLADFLGPLLDAGQNGGDSVCGNTLATIGEYVGADADMARKAERAIYDIPTPPSAEVNV